MSELLTQDAWTPEQEGAFVKLFEAYKPINICVSKSLSVGQFQSKDCVDGRKVGGVASCQSFSISSRLQ